MAEFYNLDNGLRLAEETNPTDHRQWVYRIRRVRTADGREEDMWEPVFSGSPLGAAQYIVEQSKRKYVEEWEKGGDAV